MSNGGGGSMCNIETNRFSPVSLFLKQFQLSHERPHHRQQQHGNQIVPFSVSLPSSAVGHYGPDGFPIIATIDTLLLLHSAREYEYTMYIVYCIIYCYTV